MNSKRIKLVLGMVGAGGVLAMGGLTVAVDDEDAVRKTPVIVAEDATETTVRGVPETSFAKPPITTAPYTIPTGEPQ